MVSWVSLNIDKIEAFESLDMPVRASLSAVPDERESSPMPELKDVMGTLYLVGRKTGVELQSFPIDAERVTIGR